MGFSTVEMLSKGDFKRIRDSFPSFEDHLQEGFTIDRDDNIIDIVSCVKENLLFDRMTDD